MKSRKLLLTLFLLTFSGIAYSQNGLLDNPGYQTITITVITAVGGYFAKTIYETFYINVKRRKRKLLTKKLHYFYWPICIRLKKNETVYKDLFKGKHQHSETIEYKVAHYVEENVLLKNQEEILSIITKYRHLAETDATFEVLIDSFIRHVTIYQALVDAKIDSFPAVAGNAPYPKNMESYFYSKTNELQKLLEKNKI